MHRSPDGPSAPSPRLCVRPVCKSQRGARTSGSPLSTAGDVDQKATASDDGDGAPLALSRGGTPRRGRFPTLTKEIPMRTSRRWIAAMAALTLAAGACTAKVEEEGK